MYVCMYVWQVTFLLMTTWTRKKFSSTCYNRKVTKSHGYVTQFFQEIISCFLCSNVQVFHFLRYSCVLSGLLPASQQQIFEAIIAPPVIIRGNTPVYQRSLLLNLIHILKDTPWVTGTIWHWRSIMRWELFNRIVNMWNIIRCRYQFVMFLGSLVLTSETISDISTIWAIYCLYVNC